MEPRTLSRRALSLLAACGLAAAIAAPSVTAQESSPPAVSNPCTEALGIGAEGDACVNIVHASPDAPAVDVYVDGAAALTNLAFGAFSGWVALPAGDHQVQVTATGDTADNAVIDAEVTLDAGIAYQVAAAGTLEEISAEIFTTDLSDPTAETPDGARIRVIHTSPDAGNVDVAVTGGDVLIEDLAFPDASDALVVPAGTYDLEVRPTGTEDVALVLPGTELMAGMVYDVFAIGLAEDGSLTVLVVPSPTSGAMATPAA